MAERPSGLYRAKLTQLNAVADRHAREVNWFALGTADGMESPETNGGENQPAGWKARNGQLWFPTIRGVVVVDPKAVPWDEPSPPIVIEEVKADGEEVRSEIRGASGKGQSANGQGQSDERPGFALRASRFAPRIRAGHGHVVEFRYTANTFIAPERTRFRYRLVEADADWREETTERTARYFNLRPGSYRFEVKAANVHNVWSAAPAFIDFSLTPAFWQTWTFYVCTAGAVVLAALGLHHLRVRDIRRIQRLEHQRALQEERVRIARDLHDDLGANLTGVALQLDLARQQNHAPAALLVQLEAIAERTRGLVDNMREVVWALNPQNDNVDSLADFLGQYAEKLLAQAGVRCRLDLQQHSAGAPRPNGRSSMGALPIGSGPARSLNSQVRHQLFLVVKEALHNVLRHARASEAQLVLAQDQGCLRLVVADNGCGLPVGKGRPRGHGLDNMESRVANLGGKFSLESSPNQGTRIDVTLPLGQRDS